MELELAPLRPLDDFLLSSSSRFRAPDFGNVERWMNRIVSNLLYYQTNYIVFGFLLFGLVAFMYPQDMAAGVLVMAAVFGLVFYLQTQKREVMDFKRNHPTLVFFLLTAATYYLVYKLGCIVVFFLGVLLPVVFTVAHASLRMRNVKNKIANATEALGVAKRTPMAVVLREMGIEPDLKNL